MRARRFAVALAALAALSLAGGAGQARAAFGLNGLDMRLTEEDGSAVTQAGAHPFAFTTALGVNASLNPETGHEVPDGEVKDLLVSLPEGLVGDPTAAPRCPTVEFLDIDPEKLLPACANATVVGVVTLTIGFGEPTVMDAPVYNLVPPPGAAAKFGFVALSGLPVTFEVGLNPEPPHNLIAYVTEIPQSIFFYGSELTVWGIPAAAAHDPYRGSCLDTLDGTPGVLVSKGNCPVGLAEKPFLTLPTDCSAPLRTHFEADSWQAPDVWVQGEAETHDGSVPPNPQSLTGCSKVTFGPEIISQPTSNYAESPTGLDFGVDVHDKGIENPAGIAQSTIRKAVVTLPEGVTINPSVAEGLAVCTPTDLKRETVDSPAGAGCPQGSKVGSIEVQTPLLEEALKGSVFVAKQDDPTTTQPGAENPFDALVALYMVIKDPALGVLVKLPGKVEPDPRSGQLVTTFGESPYEIPKLPFSHFHFHFREGGRSPLITPPGCGKFTSRATFTPWVDPAAPFTTSASFTVDRGVNGGPCPKGGLPFEPGFSAGALNNAAGQFSPFYMRLTRRDGDQDLTKFSATLPPGVSAKLAGTDECPDAAIAAARAKTGRAELAHPSCPASSQIGDVFGGAGVGSELTYVPGKIYLAGPYNGAPLSVAAIVPAVAGPFDVGNVVTRVALRVDPRTGRVEVDGAASNPLPHILKGIPLRVRDIRVSVDRPEFTLNPTSCEPFQIGARIWGGGSDVFSSADDSPVSLSRRFQAANCASLGFKPDFSLKLNGGTKRGAHPALTGAYRPRSGDANLKALVLRLPHSAFLDQGHIRTICTRVQFAQKACPVGSVYGHVQAFTPILSEPLEGPVYLRSSNHNLPDLVAALHGIVDVEAVARIDSIHGGIRASFEELPDAPLTKVVVRMQGATKGLIINSTDLCSGRHFASAELSAQNGKALTTHPPVKASCASARKRQGRRPRRAR